MALESWATLVHRSAYANSARTPPGVVVLDLRLPKVRRIEVLTQIRSDRGAQEPKVGVVTSSEKVHDLMESYQLRGNRDVCKPVAFNEVARMAADPGMYWVLVNQIPPDIGPG
jgi:two-component system, response regulator